MKKSNKNPHKTHKPLRLLSMVEWKMKKFVRMNFNGETFCVMRSFLRKYKSYSPLMRYRIRHDSAIWYQRFKKYICFYITITINLQNTDNTKYKDLQKGTLVNEITIWTILQLYIFRYWGSLVLNRWIVCKIVLLHKSF